MRMNDNLLEACEQIYHGARSQFEPMSEHQRYNLAALISMLVSETLVDIGVKEHTWQNVFMQLAECRGVELGELPTPRSPEEKVFRRDIGVQFKFHDGVSPDRISMLTALMRGKAEIRGGEQESVIINEISSAT